MMKLRHHRFLLSVLLLALCFALSSCSAAGFVPKSDTTWGELFRHFDSEEFSELDPQLQQMMDEAVLSQERHRCGAFLPFPRARQKARAKALFHFPRKQEHNGKTLRPPP